MVAVLICASGGPSDGEPYDQASRPGLRDIRGTASPAPRYGPSFSQSAQRRLDPPNPEHALAVLYWMVERMGVGHDRPRQLSAAEAAQARGAEKARHRVERADRGRTHQHRPATSHRQATGEKCRGHLTSFRSAGAPGHGASWSGCDVGECPRLGAHDVPATRCCLYTRYRVCGRGFRRTYRACFPLGCHSGYRYR